MSKIALEGNAKLIEFKATQTIVVSLMEELATADLVNTSKECANQMDRDLARLKVDLVKFTNKIKEILKSQKAMTSGSRMSHK